MQLKINMKSHIVQDTGNYIQRYIYYNKKEVNHAKLGIDSLHYLISLLALV